MEPPLKNQTALVTGGNSGIGAAVCEALAADGGNVAINYVTHPEEAEKLAAAIKAQGGRAITVEGDVSSEDDVEKMFAQVVAEFGALDILVSNAGIEKTVDLVDMTLNQWQAVQSVNLTGAFLCARAAARVFLKQGITQRSVATGKIVFTSSVHEVIPWTGNSNYCASKGGLRLFMQTIAQELAPHGIRVNSVGPGAIKTAINQAVWSNEALSDAVLKLIPQGRWGKPEDIARAVVWLASDNSDYVNGTTLFVDGGMLLYPSFEHNG